MNPPAKIGVYYPDGTGVEPQAPAEVAVVTPTLGGPAIVAALEGVYAQAPVRRIQLAIGVDRLRQDPAPMLQCLARRPAHVSALVLRLPYSTAQAWGGVHTPEDGGALRAILSLAANARRVAFLDDDNTWAPEHLDRLTAAIDGKGWAASRRMLVDGETGRDLGVDVWHSVGPDQGDRAATGGFVDPNCLLLDKAKLAAELGEWAQTLDGQRGLTSDERFFRSIRNQPHALIDDVTVRYRIRRTNILYERLARPVSNAPV